MGSIEITGAMSNQGEADGGFGRSASGGIGPGHSEGAQPNEPTVRCRVIDWEQGWGLEGLHPRTGGLTNQIKQGA